MITLTRQLAQRQHDLIRRCLGKRFCPADLPVMLQSDTDYFRLRCWLDRDAIEFQTPAPNALDHDQVIVPLEALKACAGSRSDPVTFERTDANQAVVRWSDRGIPQVASFNPPELKGEFPPNPDRMQQAGQGFLAALRAAVDTIETDSIRYATDCMRIRGEQGTLAATDTRQALVQSGFQFPFAGELLVRPNPVFKSAVFSDDADVEIGRTENWLTIRIGAWTIHMAIEKERRFPDVEGCLPVPAAVKTRLMLSQSDAGFLERSLSRLPLDNTLNGAVTVDLNGTVAVRAKSSDCPVPTELVLTGSSRLGSEICLAADRRYWERAVRLGFREVGFVSDEAPAVCRDRYREYIWATLSKDGIVKADSNAVRIESPPFEEVKSTESKPAATAREDKPQPRSNGRSHQSLEPAIRETTDVERSDVDPVRQARLARDTLRAALPQNRELLKALMQQRRPSRRPKATALR